MESNQGPAEEEEEGEEGREEAALVFSLALSLSVWTNNCKN